MGYSRFSTGCKVKGKFDNPEVAGSILRNIFTFIPISIIHRNPIISKTLSGNMCIVAEKSKAQVIKPTFRGNEFKPHKCLMFGD